MIPLARLALPLSFVCLAACDGPRPAPPPKQPSVLDRAIAPAVSPLGVRVAPQGGLLIPTKPPP